jgi:hypothetical protein
MTIELLGDNCRKCRLLKSNIEVALQGVGTNIDVREIEEPEKFAEYGLLSLPGLAVDGVVKAEGRLLSIKEITDLLS